MARFLLKAGKTSKAPKGMNKGNFGPFMAFMGGSKSRLANATSRPVHGMVTRQKNAEKAYERGRGGAQLGRGIRGGSANLGGFTNMGSGTGKASGASRSVPLRKPTSSAPTDMTRVTKAARSGSRKAAKRVSVRY